MGRNGNIKIADVSGCLTTMLIIAFSISTTELQRVRLARLGDSDSKTLMCREFMDSLEVCYGC